MTAQALTGLLPATAPLAPVVAAVVSAAVVTAVAADLLKAPAHVRVLVTRSVLSRGHVLRPRDVRTLFLPEAEVPPGALTRWPPGSAPLYTTLSLGPGMPLTPEVLSPTAPSPLPRLSQGEVGVAVTVPTQTLPGSLRPGTQVAIAGTLTAGGIETLIAMRAQVVSVSPLSQSAGLAPSERVTLSLPVAVALAAETANHNGTLALLPWSLAPSQDAAAGGVAS